VDVVTETASGVERMKAENPLKNSVGAKGVSVVFSTSNVPLVTLTREKWISSSSHSNDEFSISRCVPEDKTRGDIESPSVSLNEKRIRSNTSVPELLIPAVPLPPRSSVKESFALSVVCVDLTVVLERVSLVDVSPSSVINNSFPSIPLRCPAPTVTVLQGEEVDPHDFSSFPFGATYTLNSA
jgi:hypothetical protein